MKIEITPQGYEPAKGPDHEKRDLEEFGLRPWTDPEAHEAYEALREPDGSRVIGAIGPDKVPAVFKANPAKPELIHRVEVRLEDLTNEESKRYDRIIESARELDELRSEEK